MSDPSASVGARSLVRALVVAAVVWHVLAVCAFGWTQAANERQGRDYASYHYALEVARAGGDPYDTRALERASKGVRRTVNPYFYPPPFLLALAWIPPGTPLDVAYRWWFWLDEAALVAAVAALAIWWRALGPTVGVTLAAAVAALTAIPNNHVMGQANLLVLALALGGLASAAPLDGRAPGRGREIVGGVALGLACMFKMAPALLVAWLVLRRRPVAVAAACATAVVSSVLALPLVDASTQLRFYTEVLPGFSTGDYNGLTVDPSLFGNHSVPNWWDGALPKPGNGLSTGARWLSRLTALGLVGGLAYAFRRPAPDPLGVASQASAVMVVMLLVPVYTYEHHVVWAIPAVVVSAIGLARGRVPGWLAAPVGFAVAAWAFDLAALKELALSVDHLWGQALRGALQEIKAVALLILLVATVLAGRGQRAG
jgi:hypothetical protein